MEPITQKYSLSYSRGDLNSAIHSFYTLLITLPYITAESLVLPPTDGWPNVNVSELRSRGKTHQVIDLLRHLPYLRAPSGGSSWMVLPYSLEIDYSSRGVYSSNLDAIQPTPAWCIWLTDPDSRDGTAILLDTKMGTITEFTTLGHKIMVDWEEYENITLEDRWMAHPTLPVAEFFKLWERKFQRLIWMPVRRPQGLTVEWYMTAAHRQDEEDILASDDEFRLDKSDEYDEGDQTESDSDDETKDANDKLNVEIPLEEVEELMKDAYGKEAGQRQTELLSQKSISEGSYLATVSSPVPEEDMCLDRFSGMDRKTKEVYEIYRRNGWPSSFDRKNCEFELAEFCERGVRKASKKV